MTTAVQRTVGLMVLLAAGMSSLPVAAYFLDGRSTENWIVPAQLVAMAIVGAAVTVALPALARAGAPPRRRAVIGVWWGCSRPLSALRSSGSCSTVSAVPDVRQLPRRGCIFAGAGQTGTTRPEGDEAP